jgi:GNAT superfamily N-acetyltransferase
VSLRVASRADIPALARLVRACDQSQLAWAGPGLRIPTVEEEELDWELRFARTGAWIRVAQDGDGTILGVIAFATAQVSRDDHTLLPGVAHVSSVFVHPDHWRRGIARTMLADAERAMSARGYDRAQLWTLEDSPAEQLYGALGWRRDGRREAYASRGLPIVAYVKTLAADR